MKIVLFQGASNEGIFSLNTIQADSSYSMTMGLYVDKALDYETQDLYSITITVKVIFLNRTPFLLNVFVFKDYIFNSELNYTLVLLTKCLN